jgi:hypothetical protein
MVVGSNFRRSKVVTQGQEVEFHEIEIQLFQEVKFSFMRSKFLIMIQFPDHLFFMRSKFKKKHY